MIFPMLLVGFLAACVVDPGQEGESAQIETRKQRVIFNGDSAVLMHPGASTVEGFLAPRLEALPGTPVTTISWSILAGDAPSYDSRIQPIYGDAQQSDRPDYMNPYASNLKTLVEAGTCPLKIVTDFAHEHGMEAFASLRMNDVHDSFVEGHLSRWKLDHREFLVSTRGLQTAIAEPAFPGSPVANLYSTALDFTHQVVRDRKFEIIEEVCLRYDLDGVELDFIRHPVLFKSIFEGEAVTPEQVSLMTAFIRRVRQRMDEIGEERGRPLLLAVRTPDDLELSLGIGLDLEAWMREGLVDMLFLGGGYAHFSLPVAKMAKAAHAYGVPLYPCINNPGQLMDGRGIEMTRALATKWYAAGADGIYFWNLTAPWEQIHDEARWRALRKRVYASLNGIDNPEALEGKEKIYSAAEEVWFPYAFISSRGDLPVSLEPGGQARVPIVIGDDVPRLVEEGRLESAELTLELQGVLPDPEQLIVSINGQAQAGGQLLRPATETEPSRVAFALAAGALRQGENLVEAGLSESSPGQDLTLLKAQLRLVPGEPVP
jgi:hypothetical protein